MIRTVVEELGPYAEGFGLFLDDDAITRLTTFVELLEAWNRRYRLTGDRDPVVLVRKHCADSLAAAGALADGFPAADVGSGAGFPGIVCACVRPDAELVLIDSRERACTFLAFAAADLGLSRVRVVNQRVEEAATDLPRAFASATSRALLVEPIAEAFRSLLRPSGQLLLMVAPRQIPPAAALANAGFVGSGTTDYRLPTGEPRRIVRYVLA